MEYPLGYFVRNSHDMSGSSGGSLIPEGATIGPFTTPMFPTMSPGFTPQVHKGLTIGFLTLYSALFILAYIQLWLLFYYRHKRLSYQSVFLFLCLLWSGLRITLFSFYLQNVRLANDLPIFPYWLLYCFPVCIQFSLLCLLVLYFAQLLVFCGMNFRLCGFSFAYFYNSLSGKTSPSFLGRRFLFWVLGSGPRRYRLYLRLGMALAVMVFLGTDVSCAALNKLHQEVTLLFVVMTRVIICDSLFILAGIGLSLCVYKLATMSSANILLEAKGATVCQATWVCVATIMLYVSRAIYDLIAIAIPQSVPGFDYGWINVSDEADLFNIHVGYGYLSFGLVLFFWEFLPTFIVIIFFRVRRPNIIVTQSTLTTSQNQSVGSYFFQQSRRFSSDEDITRTLPSSLTGSRASLEPERLSRSFNAGESPLARRLPTFRRFTPPAGEARLRSQSIPATQSLIEQDELEPPTQTLANAGVV